MNYLYLYLFFSLLFQKRTIFHLYSYPRRNNTIRIITGLINALRSDPFSLSVISFIPSTSPVPRTPRSSRAGESYVKLGEIAPVERRAAHATPVAKTLRQRARCYMSFQFWRFPSCTAFLYRGTLRVCGGDNADMRRTARRGASGAGQRSRR